MEIHETVRQMTHGQFKDIVATLIGAIPELTFDEAKRVIGDKGNLVVSIREVFERHADRSGQAPANWLVGRQTSQSTVPTLSFPPLQTVEEFENWLQQVFELERNCHLVFFGQEFDLAQFELILKKYGPEKIKAWLALGLEPHFLPKVAMTRDAQLPGWKVKPNDWFWQQLQTGKILRNRNGELVAEKTAELEGVTVLVDTRLKPRYKNGRQMWEGDTLLGPILIQLREAGKIAKYEYGAQNTRFGVSTDELEKYVNLALAEKLGLESNQVRPERAIEANAIPQLYHYMLRKDDGKTNTWVLYEEYFEDRSDRLYGGYSVHGGLAGVGWYEAWYPWHFRSFRLLAVL